MVASLRAANIRAELYLGNPKHSLGQQMKYADRRNAPCAIVQGSDEKAKGKVQIKDLVLGAGLTDSQDRDEYLKKQAQAQYEVDQDKLVDTVREILARHNAGSRDVLEEGAHTSWIMCAINSVLRLLGVKLVSSTNKKGETKNA